MKLEYSGPADVDRVARTAAAALREQTNNLFGLKPRIMIVLGSGCGLLAKNIHIFDEQEEIPYESILGMPPSTVEGHKGALLIGTYGDVPVLGFQGRKHYYEGASPQEASFPVYLAKYLGAKVAIMTTATGIAPWPKAHPQDLPSYPAKVGETLLIATYYPNLLPSSLRGPITPEVGPRFQGTINVPSIALGILARSFAATQGITLNEAIYVPRQGPLYETPAEIALLSELSGATGLPVVAGMSIVPELEAAAMLGIDTAVFAVVTNHCFDMAARREIVGELEEKLGAQSGAEKRPTLKEINKLVSEAIASRQPSHEEVAAAAGSEAVTKRLDSLIGGLVRAIRFDE